MFAAWAPFGFLAGLFLAALCLTLRHVAFGRCVVCETERSPRCQCPGGDPKNIDVRRPKFRSRDDYKNDL